jgi:hypothetical protein
MPIVQDRASLSVACRTRERGSSGISSDIAVLSLSSSSSLLKRLRPDYPNVWIAFTCLEEIL